MKNVIFDLGGVVVDWNPRRLLDRYPGGPQLPLFLFERGFFEKYWTEFDRGELTQTEMVREMADFSGRSYGECWDFVEYIKYSLVDIPRSVELIKELSVRGYRLFCLSNISIEFYDYLKGRDVFTYFEGHIISALEKVIKPEEAIYRVLFERYGLVPEESLFIDDLEANVKAAAALGMNTVHFAAWEWGYHEINRLLKLEMV